MTEVQDLTFEIETENEQSFSLDSFDLHIPGYQVVGLCGSGGTAKVYVAIQNSVSRQVALKVMHPHLVDDETRVSHFLQEGRINANLSHANIVPIHHVGAVDDYHYIVMEYMPWGNLRRHLKELHDLDWIINVVKQIAKALAYSHDHGIIHRDIKPENILFRDDDSVVLSDFGIADELEHRNKIKTKSSHATPRYMCPDLLRSQPIGPSSDIYSLGTVLFEMLAGRPPYDSGIKPYTRKDVITVQFAHLKDPIPELPAEYQKLQPVINKMLAKQPKDRFAIASDVIDALTMYQNKY